MLLCPVLPVRKVGVHLMRLPKELYGPVVCPKCGKELLVGVHRALAQAGYDAYCPHCKHWSHIAPVKVKPLRKGKKTNKK